MLHQHVSYSHFPPFDRLDRLRPLLAGDMRLQLARLQPVLATPTEIFLARQLIVVLCVAA